MSGGLEKTPGASNLVQQAFDGGDPGTGAKRTLTAQLHGAGGSFHLGLPYWSKVEKLTIHLKTVTDPASADPARLPISQIDMALSEGVTRKFALCMRAIGSVPNDAPAATTFLNARATPAEIAAAQATSATHRDLWIKVALRAAGSITGPEERDLRVVHELFTLSSTFGTVLTHRDLSGFAD